MCIRDRSPSDTGNDVAHAVVVAQLFVLIMPLILSGLGGPEAGFLNEGFIVSEEHPTARSGDDFIPIKGQNR